MSRTEDTMSIVNNELQNLQEIVNFISEGSVPISRYDKLKEEKINSSLVLNSIRYNISTIISSIQLESEIPYNIRNKYKNILHHLNNMIDNNG
jgi:hypothetical protein